MQPRVDAGFFLLTLSHLVSNSKILVETRCSAEHMVRRTPAQWSTCWASRGCGAGAPGHGQSVRLICNAGRLPRAWTLGRSDTACHCFEDLQIWRKLWARQQSHSQSGTHAGPHPTPPRGAGRRKPWRLTASRLYCRTLQRPELSRPAT